MYPKYKKINSSGFTLIEIIASITLLGTIVVILLPFFPQVMSWTQNTDDELVASNLLSQVADDIKEIDIEQSLASCPSMQSVDQTKYEEYSSYTLNNKTYSVELFACVEDEVDLYRTNIQIKTDNRLVSESYTYISGDQE